MSSAASFPRIHAPVELRTRRGRCGVSGSAGGGNKLNIKKHERSFSQGASEVAVAMKDVTSSQEVAAPLWPSSAVEFTRAQIVRQQEALISL